MLEQDTSIPSIPAAEAGRSPNLSLAWSTVNSRLAKATLLVVREEQTEDTLRHQSFLYRITHLAAWLWGGGSGKLEPCGLWQEYKLERLL